MVWFACLWFKSLLKNGAVINLIDRLPQKIGRGMPQHVPILFEDTEVCGVAGLAVSCGYNCEQSASD